jgi:uncharacterized protein YcnI
VRARLLVLFLGSLALASAAQAHVSASPSFVRQGSQSELRLVVPNERAPQVTTALTVTMPVGLEVRSASAPSGWEAAVSGARRVSWRGGTIGGISSVEFALQVQTTAEPGTVSLEAVQRYDDGRVVRWKTPLTVIPGTAGSESTASRLLLAALVAAALVAATVFAVLRLRRREANASARQ